MPGRGQVYNTTDACITGRSVHTLDVPVAAMVAPADLGSSVHGRTGDTAARLPVALVCLFLLVFLLITDASFVENLIFVFRVVFDLL
jgi:hypothetical protein